MSTYIWLILFKLVVSTFWAFLHNIFALHGEKAKLYLYLYRSKTRTDSIKIDLYDDNIIVTSNKHIRFLHKLKIIEINCISIGNDTELQVYKNR